MPSFRKMHLPLLVLTVCWLAFGENAFGQPKETVATPADIIATTGTGGGFCLRLGGSDDGFEVGLARTGRFVVLSLSTDRKSVERLRAAADAAGMTGLVTAQHDAASGDLPVTDKVVNLLVVDSDAPGFKMPKEEEFHRVMAPMGIAWIRRDGKWEKQVKPFPTEMGSWTHFAHDSEGSLASRSERYLKPVNAVRWIGGHNNELMSADPRVVSGLQVCPVNTRNATGTLVPQLVARDAFSGVRRWQTPARGADSWLIAKDGLVVARDVVALRAKKPMPSFLYVLDLANGRELRLLDKGLDTARGLGRPATYKGNYFGTPQSLMHRGLVVQWDGDRLVALSPTDGSVAWTLADPALRPVFACAEGETLYVLSADPASARNGGYDRPSYTAQATLALDIATGKLRWRSDAVKDRLVQFFMVGDGIVLAANRYSLGAGAFDDAKNNQITALSVKDGSVVWRRDALGAADKRARMFNQQIGITDGKVMIIGSNWGFALDARTGADAPGAVYCGVDGTDCLRYTAVPGYFLTENGRMTGLDGSFHEGISKGICWSTYTPAHGGLYFTGANTNPSVAKHLSGHSCVWGRGPVQPIADDQRLERGAVQVAATTPNWPRDDEWPTYLGSVQRRFSAKAPIQAPARTLWSRKVTTPRDTAQGVVTADWNDNFTIAGRVSAPVVADGMVIVAVSDAHRLAAFDASTGEPRWSFDADGRIGGPPTLYAGLCLFGSNDGWVYCLETKTGQLVWRFRAALDKRQIVAWGQVESTHPVPAPVVIWQGSLWCIAGRHGNTDGGMMAWRLDPFTGAVQGKWPVPNRADPRMQSVDRNKLKEIVVTPGREADVNGPALGARTNDVLQVNESGLVLGVLPGWSVDPATGKAQLYQQLQHEHGSPQGMPLRGCIVPNPGDSQHHNHSWIHDSADINRNAMAKHVLACPGTTAGDTGLIAIGADGLAWRPSVDRLTRKLTVTAYDPNPAKPEEARRASFQLDSTSTIQDAMIIAGDRMVLIQDAKIHALSLPEGKRLGEPCPIVGDAPINYGMATAYGRVYLVTRDGTLSCYAPSGRDK